MTDIDRLRAENERAKEALRRAGEADAELRDLTEALMGTLRRWAQVVEDIDMSPLDLSNRQRAGVANILAEARDLGVLPKDPTP